MSILPSLKGFTRLLKADLKKSLAQAGRIEIPVTPVLDRTALQPLSLPGQRVRIPVEIDRDSYRRSLAGLGRDHTVRQRVEVDVDRDRFGRLLGSAISGGDSGAKAGASIGNAMLSPLSGILSNPLTGIPAIILGAVATAVVALPAAVVAATATAGLAVAGAGLGAIFFGGFLLRGDKELQAGVKKLFGQVSKTLTEAAQPLKGPFLEALSIVGQAFKDIAPDIKSFFKTIADSGAIQELARGFGGLIKSFAETGALKKLGESIGPVLKQIGMALPDIGNAISQFLISITKPETVDFIGKLFRGIADGIRLAGSIIGWLASKWDNLWNAVTSVWQVIQDVWSGLKLIGNAVVGALTANMDKVRPLLDILKRVFGDLTSKISEIPKKITGALGNAGTLLLNAGKSIVNGLIDGIKSKFSALSNVVGNVSSLIGSFFPNSPQAKQGALSGTGNPGHRGQAIALGIAGGMESQLPAVRGAADQLAGSVGFGSTSRAIAAAPASPTVRFAGPDAILELMRKLVEVEGGGNVQFAFGRG